MNKNLSKKAFALCICITITILNLLPLTAYSANTNKTIRVGYFKFDGYHIINESDVKSGYGYEALQKLAVYNDWDYEYVGYEKSWSEMMTMLENGEIDMVTSAQKTESRLEKFDFSEDPIGTSSTILTIKSGDERFIPKNYNSYNGMRIGLLQDSTRNDSFANFAREKGFSYSTVYYPDTESMEAALQDGKLIDAIVTSSLRSITNEWLLEKFDASDFYVIVKKGNSSLLNEINYAIERLNEDSPGWKTALNTQYYGANSGEQIALSEAEREYLNQIKTDNVVFKAIVSPDRAPYSYFKNGEAKGIFVDIFKIIASRAGIQYEIIQTKSRDEYNSLIDSGDIDIRIDSCFDYYDAESKEFKLTQPYLSTAISCITKTNSSTAPQTVSTLKQADITRNFYNQLFKDKESKYKESISDCIGAVISGEADCTYAYTYAAQKAVYEDVKNRISATILPEFAMKFSVAVSNKCDHRLLVLLNKGVSSLKADETQKVVLSQTNFDDAPFSVVAFIYKYPLVIFSILVIFGICIFIIVFQIIRSRNAKKERRQQAQLARFMGYVCQANDTVLEVDLKTGTAKRYYLENGQVETVTEPYRNMDYENYNNNIYPDDFNMLTANLSEEKMDKLINSGGGQEYFECRTKNNDGVYQWYAYTIQAIPKSPEYPRHFILFKKNIEKTKAEQDQQRQALTDALETSQKASAAKGIFLSRMSHEIRTPLNAVIGYMSIAKMSQGNTDKIEHCIENSETAAKHLLNIINDVLDISSIESGRIKIAVEDFDMKQLLSSISSMFYNQCKTKGVHFQVVLGEIANEWVVGDPLRTNQILMNLMSNAVKFTPKDGSVTLTVTQNSIANNAIHMTFKVKDTGIGISKEYMSRMFTPFEQENASTAQKYGGTGLGLSIIKNLVSMMDGSIDVKSEPGSGSEFTVTLPLKHSNHATEPENAQHDFSKVRALIVDDEKNDCDYVKSLFKRCGVKSDVVYNGEDAIQQIKRRAGGDYSYDLCIMDWNMPGLDGIETAKRIREECSSELPIIIATAYDISDICDRAYKVGINKIVSKPLFQSTLFDLLVSTYGKYSPKVPTEMADFTMENIRVLLAEDNEMNMEIAVDILKKAGIKVDCATNGAEAVEKLTKSQPNTYQAILMDIQMPVMNGYDATRAIRKSNHPDGKSIAIIAMTANAFSEDVADALASGMNDHIAKPIDYAKLFKSLSKNIK